MGNAQTDLLGRRIQYVRASLAAGHFSGMGVLRARLALRQLVREYRAARYAAAVLWNRG